MHLGASNDAPFCVQKNKEEFWVKEEKCRYCGKALTKEEQCEFDGKVMCKACLDEMTSICTHCGERLWNNKNSGTGDFVLCQRCYDNLNNFFSQSKISQMAF